VPVRSFFLKPSTLSETLLTLTEDPADWVLSFDLRVAGHPLPLICPQRYLTLLVDPFFYSLDLLTLKNSHLSLCDEEEFTFLQKIGVKNCLYFSHAVESALMKKQEEEKNCDLLFFGSCIDIEAERAKWPQLCSRTECEELEVITEKVLKDPTLSLLRALTESGVKEDRLAPLYLASEAYVRGVERLYLLKNLSCFDLHIYGSGPWRKYLPRATLHAPVKFSKAIALMRKARLVVNASLRFKQGLHERPLYALASHALPISLETETIQKALGSGFLGYSYGQWERLQADVRHLLSHPDVREAHVSEGRMKLSSHTFDARIDPLLNYLNRS
jgi:hypothetical protein